MFFRFRNTRQPTPGMTSFAFLGSLGKPAFLPMGNGVMIKTPMLTYQPGTYMPNNAGIAHMSLAGIVTGGAQMQPLSASDGIGQAGSGATLRGGSFYDH